MSDKHIDSYRQDNCADGCHIYKRSEWDGALRCSCGAVLDTTARKADGTKGGA